MKDLLCKLALVLLYAASIFTCSAMDEDDIVDMDKAKELRLSPQEIDSVRSQLRLDAHLKHAAESGDVSAAQQALANVSIKFRNRALIDAAETGEIDVVKLLLTELPEHQRPNMPARNAALRSAAQRDEVEVMKFLLTELPEGERPDMAAQDMAVIEAAQQGQLDAFKFFFIRLPKTQWPSMEIRNKALMWAARMNKVAIVRFLLMTLPESEQPAIYAQDVAFTLAEKNRPGEKPRTAVLNFFLREMPEDRRPVLIDDPQIDYYLF